MSYRKREIMKEYVENLERMGLVKYGSVIPGELIRSMAGIDLPEMGTREQFRDAALKELSVTDYIRGKLISRGMYLSATKGDYRIITAGENQNQIASYMKSADSKLKRAIRLHDNTPKEMIDKSVKTRIHLRESAMKEQMKRKASLN
jgi:hypothetical protein